MADDSRSFAFTWPPRSPEAMLSIRATLGDVAQIAALMLAERLFPDAKDHDPERWHRNIRIAEQRIQWAFYAAATDISFEQWMLSRLAPHPN
jgi:hypothetical protein